MADRFQFTNTLPSNFPQKKVTRSPRLVSFPEDLIIDGKRDYYTQIEFVDYGRVVNAFATENNFLTGIGGTNPLIEPKGGFYLPIPRKLDDQNMVIWEANSARDVALGLAQGAAENFPRLRTAISALSSVASPTSAILGFTINPFLYMQFKSPTFKQFSFTWTLAPSNQNESNVLKNIIDEFKYHMLPTAGVLMGYPSLALIKFFPKSEFLFRVRPCAIEAVSVDYTAAGGPSFFKSGAPTVVNLSVRFKEIEIWTKNNYVR